MPYSPPVGTANLALTGSYTPPTGTANLPIGAGAGDDRLAVIAGESLAPTGRLRIGRFYYASAAGESLAPTGAIRADYDPNLLSAVHAVSAERWQPGTLAVSGVADHQQNSLLQLGEGLARWQAADGLPGFAVEVWQSSPSLANSGVDGWQEADLAGQSSAPRWQPALRLDRQTGDVWQDGQRESFSTIPHYQNPYHTEQFVQDRWQEGAFASQFNRERFQDGHRLEAVEIEVWQQAGYPGNAPNPGPSIPLPYPTPWGTNLRIACPLPGTALRIGRAPCILIAEREIAVQRSYMSINSASLVRWPDLVPLPVTAMTIETDFDSWCWGFSATLAGSDAWALVQPNPLACEVLATINGQPWKFLLDVPSTNRAFNRDQVTLKGRSRSAWLQDPYTPATNRSEAEARTMQQLGEAALDLTGWTLNWEGEDWLVPAGRYNSFNTPIGALIRLANTTDDGLYTDPDLQILTLQKRWPVASWLIDGEVADLLIPEAAIITLSKSPRYTQPLNGVYVSGESHGVLGFVKIAGTDGALQPSDPIVNELLCDEAGVAARQRGINALSDSGSGFTMEAETLFYPPTFPLVPPGLIVSIAGMKGVSRACRVTATWSQGLQIKQSIELERREVES
jgi:hypothetical protein